MTNLQLDAITATREDVNSKLRDTFDEIWIMANENSSDDASGNCMMLLQQRGMWLSVLLGELLLENNSLLVCIMKISFRYQYLSFFNFKL